jgi:AmmeMemoRadiSam system protein B
VQADVYGGQHSVEVHLPFLQYLFDDIRFVPIMTPSSAPWKGTEVGQAIARATKKIGRDTVVIASSSATMSYPFPETRASDRRAIDWVTRMDAEGFVDQVKDKAWNGVAALEATIEFAKEMGAAQCSLLHFGRSYLSELEKCRRQH